MIKSSSSMTLPHGKGFFNITEVGEFEYQNPAEKMRHVFVSWHMQMDRSILLLKPEAFPKDDSIDMEKIRTKVMLRRALQFWEQEYQKIKAIPLTEEWMKLLECRKKKKQEKILKSMAFDSSLLIAFIFAAAESYGFTYSVYHSHHLPNDIDPSKMPTLAYKETTGDISKIGETPLSDKQLRIAIDQRNVVVSKFLDKKDIWHCFFSTYDGIAGKEPGHGSHLHYISSAFGMSRLEVLKELKKKRYDLPSFHIPFERYEEDK
jgi:hypothetical protein